MSDEDWESLRSFPKISFEMNKDRIIRKRGMIADLNKTKDILLLGMVYSTNNLKPSRGQEYRDKVRINSLLSIGYNVYSIDNKHDNEINKDNRHCRSDFSGTRRLLKDVHNQWPEISFDVIVLDYFFSPV